MCYVSVWILNAGFDNAIGFIQGGSQFGTGSDHGGSSVGEFLATPGSLNGAGPGVGSSADWTWGNPFSRNNATIMTAGAGATTGGYTAWAGLYAYFFSILVYTMLYLTVVQKSFTLISALPDKVLRWIGGQQENAGAESAQWGQEVQSKVSESGKETGGAQAQIGKRLGGESMNKASESKATEGTSAEASGAAGG